MTGTGYLELVLISMGWFAFLAALALRLRVIPGIIGSVTVFFTVGAAGRHGMEIPWPWLWVLLPLAIEPVRWLIRTRMRGSRDGS
jgi:hypothetical protein